MHQDRLEHLLERSAGELLPLREGLSGWSPAQQLFHVTLANELSLKNVNSLLAREGMLIQPLKELHPRAADVLRRGRFPPGSEAPRFVRPPDRVDLDLLRELAADGRRALAGLEGRGEEIAAAPDGVPHQRLGVLTAARWVRFARMHSAHHLRIARALLGA